MMEQEEGAPGSIQRLGVVEPSCHFRRYGNFITSNQISTLLSVVGTA